MDAVSSNVRVFETDTPIIMARKIFNHFAVNQSCTIGGFTVSRDVEPLGIIVWRFIREMDYEENYILERGRAPRRKYKEPPAGSIGGRYAHKIFRKKETIREVEGGRPVLVTIIWRVQ